MLAHHHTLRRAIMRRIYLAYAMSILRHPMTLHGVVFAIALHLFAVQVHVASVIENMLQVPLGGVPAFVMNAFLRGETLTLLAVGALCFTALSTSWKLRTQWLVGHEPAYGA